MRSHATSARTVAYDCNCDWLPTLPIGLIQCIEPEHVHIDKYPDVEDTVSISSSSFFPT